MFEFFKLAYIYGNITVNDDLDLIINLNLSHGLLSIIYVVSVFPLKMNGFVCQSLL